MKLLTLLLLLLGYLPSGAQTLPPARDTLGMPRLEIPEITIVGKKAITLPFARKGEIFDISLYAAPAPDTSLLNDRPAIPLPIGSLLRYEEPLTPLHLSAEGFLGSFTTLGARGLIDYTGIRWGMHGEAGFAASQGHVDHASGSSLLADASAHALLGDAGNAATFRTAGGLRFTHDSYGLFGFRDTTVDRKRTGASLSATLGTLSRERNAFDVSLRADLASVSDTKAGRDASTSSFSPGVAASFHTLIGATEFASALSYRSSSLDNPSPVQSPSWVSFSADGRWRMSNGWLVTLGGRYEGGSGTNGESHMLLSPYGEVRLELDRDRTVSLWIRPEMAFTTYGDLLQENPYLLRVLDVRPERKPLNAGGTLWYNSGIASLELRGSLAKSSDTPVEIADSGRISLQYVDASKFSLRANATIRLESGMLFTLFGLFQPSYEDGTTTQLPMVPVAQLGARGECSFHSPVTVWSALEYWSKQNVNLAGTTTIPDHVLLSLGASARLLPNAVFSAEVTNLLNTAYEWWGGYQAPGTRFLITAKANFR